MSLVSGTRLGRYEILAPLGEGGMGEVYQARDTRLGRSVAIKVLHRALGEDADLRRRFRREAEAIAALKHPHICVLYDVGESDGDDYLVMEHLEGETLAQRLRRGPLPVAEVLEHAVAIASALAAAHRHGFVHRDLKPGNVMLTATGAKVLDFGLAKSMPRDDAIDAEAEATRTAPVTVAGSILGTLGYMAPEQLEGKPADARSDLFAMGAILYEMATGKKAFEGSTQAALIAAALAGQPAIAPLEDRSMPPLYQRIVLKCLAKDPAERWQSAADLVEALRWTSISTPEPRSASPNPRWLRATWLIASALLLAAALVLGALALRPRPVSAPRSTGPLRLAVVPPPGTAFAPRDMSHQPQFALSPDGSRIAFVAAGHGEAPRLWVRSLRSPDAVLLPGTEDASGPFWSPDGASLAFLAHRGLYRVAADGATAPRKLAEVTYHVASGTWNADGVILLSLGGGEGLYRVPDTGGPLQLATTLDEARGETGHRWPQFLPDGRHFLFYVGTSAPDSSGVYLGSLGDDRAVMVMPSLANAVHAQPGYLLIDLNSHLVAQRFDVESAALVGEPVQLEDRIVGHWGPSFLPLSAAGNGTLALWNGEAPLTELFWVDRAGRRLGGLDLEGEVLHLVLSPDGSRLAVTRRHGNEDDIWRVDLPTGLASRVTFTGAARFAIWSPDAQWFVYSSRRELFRKSASGAGDAEQVLGPMGHWAMVPEEWARDGRWVLYTASTKTGWDVRALDLTNGETRPLLEGPENELQARLSPSGRWLAYVSDESGAWEVYVQPFPERGGRWQVSTRGGTQPQWRADGKEIFYVSAEGELIAVPVSGVDAFESGAAEELFTTRMPPMLAPYRQTYAVTPDGQRFLVQNLVPNADPSALSLLLDWPAALDDQRGVKESKSETGSSP